MLNDVFFDQVFRFPSTTITKSQTYTVEEQEDSIILKVAAWGYKKDDLDIKTEGEYLTLKGKDDTSEKFTAGLNGKYKLPRNVKRKEIKAKLEDGILTVTIPKNNEGKDRDIPIE